MRRIIPTIIFIIYFTPTLAGIGDIDQREYVDWTQPPYNNIVYFYPSPSATCTAQYVAPDIILTARHCVTGTDTNDNNKELGREFQIWTHDNRRTSVKLEKYGTSFQNDDWALLRVTDPEFHRNTFFNTAKKTKKTTVTSAGFAGMRILSNDEIKIAKNVFLNIARTRHPNNYKELYNAGANELATKHNIHLSDNRVPGSNKPGEREYKLKATHNCRITNTRITSGWFASTCDTDAGDSGGPYFKGTTIYGIVSGGISNFSDAANRNYGVLTERFSQQLSRINSTERPSEKPEAPTEEPSEEQNTEIQLNAIETDLNARSQNLETMSDQDFFDFLHDGTDFLELEKQYQAAREREQSVANKLLGGLSIGATGIGGMMLASGLAEQSADADAEAAMRAYLATFTCDWGGGTRVQGGATNIELPGGNALISLKQEYVTLASDLKLRKEQLDMPPGIESELVHDSATGGLYDDVSVGKTGGVYTSLSRAILDPDGADSAAWAEQKSASESKTKTGGIVGGVGAAGGIVGDLIINSGKDEKVTAQ